MHGVMRMSNGFAWENSTALRCDVGDMGTGLDMALYGGRDFPSDGSLVNLGP